MAKTCPKCGTGTEPLASYRIGLNRLPPAFAASMLDPAKFPGGPCVEGQCPDDEHLHLICRCGHSGIAPTREKQAR